MSNEVATIEQEKKALELEIKRFELEQRRSTALSKSAFFPDTLKGDVASAVIIYDLAQRMNISVMEVAQSIYIIYGKPSFATSFLVARLNQSGLIKGALRTVVSKDKKSAYCVAIDKETMIENVGMEVTLDMAKKEGWSTKKGSKWVTMPELMLRKRAQSFFIKEFYPQVMFGLQTQEEIIDSKLSKADIVESEIIENANEKVIDFDDDTKQEEPKKIIEEIKQEEPETIQDEGNKINTETGEIIEDEQPKMKF